jgi:hypothetical protein
MDNIFPSRKEITDRKNTYQESIINEIKSIDLNKVDFSNGNFKPRSEIVEKQKVFFWIRLYLSNDDTICKPEDIITIKHTPTNEELDTKFICYSKRGIDKDTDGQIVNYDNEDDRKVLCLMVDSDRINKDSDDIPFIRSLFRISRFYEFNLLKRDELLFINKSNDTSLVYYDVTF